MAGELIPHHTVHGSARVLLRGDGGMKPETKCRGRSK